jgi:hypothetical protein
MVLFGQRGSNRNVSRKDDWGLSRTSFSLVRSLTSQTLSEACNRGVGGRADDSNVLCRRLAPCQDINTGVVEECNATMEETFHSRENGDKCCPSNPP